MILKQEFPREGKVADLHRTDMEHKYREFVPPSAQPRHLHGVESDGSWVTTPSKN